MQFTSLAQQINKKSWQITLSALLAFSIILILIHKIDALTNFRFIESLKPFYGLFFITLFITCFFWIKKNINTKTLILITLLTQIILLAGIHVTQHLHYIFNILVGLWLITASLFIIQKINHSKSRSTRKAELNHEKMSSHSEIFEPRNIFLLSLIILCYLFFSFYEANKALYVDEKLWTYSEEKRIETYWNNIFEQDWKNTRPSDKPGITLAIISGVGLLWETPSDFQDMELHHYPQNDFLQMLFVMRIPIIIMTALSILVFYYLLAKLFNSRTSLLSIAFIGLSPILIGISRVINPDAFSWILIPTTIFLYFFYNKTLQKKYLYWTGILLGLSLLTKYIANILIVFFTIEIFIQTILLKIPKKEIPSLLKNKSFDLITIILLSLITFYILYPGVWVKLDRLLIGTLFSQAFLSIWKYFVAFIFLFACDQLFLKTKISTWLISKLQKINKFIIILVPTIFLASIILTFINTYTTMSLVDFEFFLSSPKTAGSTSAVGVFLSGLYGILFSIHPFVVLGLLLAFLPIFKQIFAKKYSFDDFNNYFIWQLLFFIIIFYAASVFSKVTPVIRYQIIIYPIIMVISSFGYILFLQKKKYYKKLFYITIFLIIVANILSLWIIKPHFFSYNSILLQKKYIVNPKDIGDGNYETAKYLNNLPNAEKLTIWSDKNGVCNLFVGNCFSVENLDDFILHGPDYDYFVISRGRETKLTRLTEQRLENNPNLKLRLDRLYSTDNILHEINPGNRDVNYIRILDGGSVNVLNK